MSEPEEKPRRVITVEPSRTGRNKVPDEGSEKPLQTAEPVQVNPHQEAINNLLLRVLPRVRQLPFAKNEKHPWLGNATVDKAVLATITTIFMLADEDRAAAVEVEVEVEPPVIEEPAFEEEQPVTNTVETGPLPPPLATDVEMDQG